MPTFIVRLGRSVTAFWDDTSGFVLPYVTVLMVVFIGLGALALDGGRFMSTQTQMQAIADALALTGARELDTQSGARSRATSAINNLVSNGLTGMGYNGAITHATPVFYSALPVATAGFTGTAATSDQDAKFVAVTVNPVTIPTMLPIGLNNFSAGAQAIAGFKSRAVCGVSPVFICNPYETSGMTDAQATAALYAALDPNDPSYDASMKRRLFRMLVVGNNTSPGHFGWLQSTGNIDGCNPNSTPCLNKLIAYDNSSLSRSCFDGNGVQMATGNKPVAGSFNDRFDIYSGNGPSANFTPSINVRKGYVAGGGGNWCNATQGDYLNKQVSTGATPLTPAQTTSLAGAAKNATSITGNSVVTVQDGMSVSFGTGAGAAVVGTVNGKQTAVTIVNTSKLSAAIPPNSQVNYTWLTAPLPTDSVWSGLCTAGTCLQGNGDWDCLNYWTINHSTAAGGLTLAAPPGCTASNPTISRADVYKYENDNATNLPTNVPIKDYSGYPRSTVANGESGAPLCAINKNGFTPTFDATYDPRIVHVAVINCLAQTQLGNIGGGNSGPPTPVAGFAKYFLTQPYNSDGQNYLYGEVTGLVNSLDSVRIFNQVQLYR